MSFGLYLHIPVCKERCGYCDFYSEAATEIGCDRLIAAILCEADLRRADWAGETIDSVYLGGGTPSALGVGRLVSLLHGIRTRFPIDADAEWTVEVNPESATPALLKGCANAGVNRLSVGIQSFDDDSLRMLGRLHDHETAIDTIRTAKQSGFSSISLDLIYGLPGPAAGSRWEQTLREAIALEPQHLSCYLLTLEPGVPMARAVAAGRLRLPDDEMTRDAYAEACRRLAEAGYEHYEISNWCRRGHACRHNRNVWEGGSYLGLGPGAHGYDGRVRSVNRADLKDYLDALEGGRLPDTASETIGERERIEERIMLGLRLREGIEWDSLQALLNPASIERLRQRASSWTAAGFLEDDGRRLRIGDEGLFVSSRLMVELIGELEGDGCGSHSYMTG